ncbi:hypothetical protein MDS_2358 [Ectopseudomonas mendocina NK-01]|nr:hypothetical protein MDS_2358 [Pseudomonas mendocina NK-01]
MLLSMRRVGIPRQGQLRRPSGWRVLLNQKGIAPRRFKHASTRFGVRHPSMNNIW